MTQHLLNNDLEKRVIETLPDILDIFGIVYRILPNRLVMACPVHGGDNASAVNIFTDGSKIVGNWKCWTNHCEENYGYGILGFVHGILVSEGKSENFQESVKWIREFLKNPIPQGKIRTPVTQTPEPEPVVFKTRIEFRNSVNIPAKYYLGRNYLAETLNKFDVGMCLDKKNRHYMRVIVPAYDEFGYNIIGTMARSINPYCDKCKMYHMESKPCPRNNLEKYWAQKWLNSKGFHKSKTLYNIWNAKPYIKATKTAILVEGPGDVWRLDEAGIYNAVGLFGVEFNKHQSELLQKLGVMNIVLITDTDEAGKHAAEKLKKKFYRDYNIYQLSINIYKEIAVIKDVGEMTVEQVKETIKPELEKVCGYDESISNCGV